MPKGEHINVQGEFESDLILGIPPNYVPLKIGGQVDYLLWQIAEHYEQSDKPIFGADLKTALINVGFKPPSPEPTPRSSRD